MVLAKNVISVIILFKIAAAVELPSYFPRCYRDDPEISDCILKGFSKVKPYVPNGISEVGLPSLNPLVIPKLKFGQNVPLANYSVDLRDFTVEGLDNYKVNEFLYDPETLIFQGTIEYNTIGISGYYDIHGLVVSIPLEGRGFTKVTMGPVIGSFQINGNLRKIENLEYYNTTNVDVKLFIGDASIYVSNILDNPSLTAITNNLLNTNSKLVMQAITPAFQKLAEIAIRNLMTSLTNALPYDQMFPYSSKTI